MQECRQWTKVPWTLTTNKVLSPAEKSVLIVLIHYRRNDGICYPSITRIQKDLSFARSTVYKAIKRLEYLGILEKASRGNSIKKSNTYRLFLSDEIFEQGTPEKMIEVARKHNWFLAKKELASSPQNEMQVHNSSSL